MSVSYNLLDPVSPGTSTQNPYVGKKRKQTESKEAPSPIQAISNKRFKVGMNATLSKGMMNGGIAYASSSETEKERDAEEQESELDPVGLRTIPPEIFCYHIAARLNSRALISLLECDRANYSLVTSCPPLINSLQTHRLKGQVINELLNIADKEKKELETIKEEEDLYPFESTVSILCKIAKELADDVPQKAIAMMEDAVQIFDRYFEPSDTEEYLHHNINPFTLYQSGGTPSLRQRLLWLKLIGEGSQQNYLPILQKGLPINTLDEALEIAQSIEDDSKREKAIEVITDIVYCKGGTVEEINCLQNLVGTIQSPDVKSAVLAKIAVMQARYNIDTAKDLMKSISIEEKKDWAQVQIAAFLCVDKLVEALSMIDSISELSAKDDAWVKVVLEIASSDSAEALKIASLIQDVNKKVKAFCAILCEPSLTLENAKSVVDILMEMSGKEECDKAAYYLMATAMYPIDESGAVKVLNLAEQKTGECLTGWVHVSLCLQPQHPDLARKCFQRSQEVFRNEYVQNMDQFWVTDAFQKMIYFQAFFDPESAFNYVEMFPDYACEVDDYLTIICMQAGKDVGKAVEMIDRIQNPLWQAQCLCEIAWLTSKNDVKLTHDILRRIVSIFDRKDAFLDPEKVKVSILARMNQILASMDQDWTQSIFDS